MTRARGVPAAREGRSVAARPFLKWAGGKTQLLAELTRRLPDSFGSYHEPFLGGGALFFELSRRSLPAAFLSDRNRALIEAYTAVRDDVEGVIRSLSRYRDKNDAESYYRIRARNTARLSPAGRAARLIYLNRTCYNGLYRENRRGEFNVPFGRYRQPKICDPENLRAVAGALRSASLECAPYGHVRESARAGDLVYFDPPYHPLSATSSFTAYSRDGFGPEDQRDLRDLFAELAGRGVHVLLSNSDTPLIRRLYGDFPTERLLAARAINSRGSGRGKIGELLIRGV